jgi:Co/Zn/Cd efflux system component
VNSIRNVVRVVAIANLSYLSVRNDALANVAIISAGITTIFWDSSIPDLAVGLAIGMLNANAAIKVWKSTEH